MECKGVSALIQRRLQQWNIWSYLRMWRWWEVSLDLFNYLNRFSPHLAEWSEPLRQICRQNVEFELTESVCVAFFKDKSGNIEKTLHFHISILAVLPLCRPMHLRKDLVLYFYKIPNQSCLHQGHWLEVRGITKTWKESVWQQFGAWRNSITFLYGKEFTLETDQKPLFSIYKKTHGGDFPKDPDIDCQKLSIPAIWCAVQERHGNSTGRHIEQSYSNSSGRGWNSTSNSGS